MTLKFLAVDGFNLIRRIFEARDVQRASDMIQVIDATRASLLRAINQHNPTHVAVVMEDHDKTWRHLLLPEYKANRSETPIMLLNSLGQIESSFKEIGVQCCSVPSYEADDVIATIATVVADHLGDVIILSTDKTYLQLLSDHIHVFDHFANLNCDAAFVKDRYGVEVFQYVDYLSLVGDKSNNIKGVTGIGKVTAASLLDEYQSLEAILNTETEDAKVTKVQLEAVFARRCQHLLTLKTDVSLNRNLKSFRLERPSQGISD